MRLSLHLYIVIILSMLGVCNALSAQESPYQYRLVLENTEKTEVLYPCYSPIIIDPAEHGSVELEDLNGAKWGVRYIPESGFVGKDTVVVEYKNRNDRSGVFKYASFIFEYVSSFVEAKPDFIQVYMNQSDIEFYPLQNDSSTVSGSQPLYLSNVSHVNRLTADIQNDSTVIFTPETDYVGFAYINYLVCDAYNVCKNGVVTVSVIDTNNIDSELDYHLILPEDSKTTQVHDLVNPIISTAAAHGVAECSSLYFYYKPYSDFFGLDTVVISQGNLVRRYFIQVIAQDEPSNKLANDKFHTPRNKEIEFNVALNDVAAIVDRFAISIDQGPTKGTLQALNNKGLFHYTPQANYDGIQTFSYKICPNGICERATVTLLIGDYEPNTNEEYQFKTYKNLPILLSYSVPVNAYNFSSSLDRVEFYPGWDTVTVSYGNNSCTKDIAGYNMLVYYPPLNTVLTESFTISYCIEGTNQCVDADCTVEVMQETKNCLKQCVGDCVWPGDINNDGEVDMHDLLVLGYNLGCAGSARPYTGSSFRSHAADNWGMQLANSDVNSKHADTDGNGIVNSSDSVAISNNYRKTHSLVPNPVYERGDYPVDFVILNPDVDSGDVIFIEFRLGDDTYPALRATGYSYELDYNKEALYEPSLSVSFYENDWFSNGVSTLSMYKKPWDGRLESGGVRANANMISGKGGVELIQSVIEEDLNPFGRDGFDNALIPFYFKNITIMNGAGELVQVPDVTVYAKRKTSQKGVLDDSKLIVRPNPASDILNIHLNGDNELQAVQILSLDGRSILQNKCTNNKHFTQDLSLLNNGLYLVQIQTKFGPLLRRIQVSK
jgi:hypothetical protein